MAEFAVPSKAEAKSDRNMDEPRANSIDTDQARTYVLFHVASIIDPFRNVSCPSWGVMVAAMSQSRGQQREKRYGAREHNGSQLPFERRVLGSIPGSLQMGGDLGLVTERIGRSTRCKVSTRISWSAVKSQEGKKGGMLSQVRSTRTTRSRRILLFVATALDHGRVNTTHLG